MENHDERRRRSETRISLNGKPFSMFEMIGKSVRTIENVVNPIPHPTVNCKKNDCKVKRTEKKVVNVFPCSYGKSLLIIDTIKYSTAMC